MARRPPRGGGCSGCSGCAARRGPGSRLPPARLHRPRQYGPGERGPKIRPRPPGLAALGSRPQTAAATGQTPAQGRNSARRPQRERLRFPHPRPRVWRGPGQLRPRGCYRFSKLRLSILLCARPGTPGWAQRPGLRGARACAGARAAASGSPRTRPARRRAAPAFLRQRGASPRSGPESAGARPGPAGGPGRPPRDPPARPPRASLPAAGGWRRAWAGARCRAFHPGGEPRAPSTASSQSLQPGLRAKEAKANQPVTGRETQN